MYKKISFLIKILIFFFISTSNIFKGIIVNSAEKILVVVMKKNINIFIKKDIFLGINFTK